ncbi:acetate uptake transporter [Tomitella gaofuii]|uniref:acetate uptake transporter n=1 Tax=Tomitella gaofuii TaxID=2760083 RepID=UPI0015F7D117|nr:acetate uptake transporter [Tomitella gaofuii]
MTQPSTSRIPGAHIADPGALGLGAFALTTFVLSVVNAGLVDAEPVVFGLALAYGGIAQFAAGLWEFAKGNTFGATAFCSFGGFWISFWYLTSYTDLTGLAGNSAEHGVALYLLAWGIFTTYMLVASLRTNWAIFTVFLLLAPTFFVLAAGDFSGSEAVAHAGGWLGILTAIAAWYASFAVVTNATFKKTVLPVGPR